MMGPQKSSARRVDVGPKGERVGRGRLSDSCGSGPSDSLPGLPFQLPNEPRNELESLGVGCQGAHVKPF